MMIFWWSGRGYFTPLILLGTLSVFGLMLQVAQSVIPDRLTYWGIAFLVAATLNWVVGSRYNSKKRAMQPSGLGSRLLYKSRNAFFSMPMETFSIVIAVAGIVMIVYDFATPGAF